MDLVYRPRITVGITHKTLNPCQKSGDFSEKGKKKQGYGNRTLISEGSGGPFSPETQASLYTTKCGAAGVARLVKNLRADASSAASFSTGMDSAGEMAEMTDKRRTSEESALENIVLIENVKSFNQVRELSKSSMRK